MKKSRKKFILEAHAEACETWKERIEEEYPKLFKEEEFKVGDWVIAWAMEDTVKIIEHRKTYFLSDNMSDDKFRKQNLGRKNINRKATEEEIKTHLIAEAKKRGFKEGVNVKDVDGDSGIFTGKFNFDADKLKWGLWSSCGNLLLFNEKDQWAEIIHEPKELTHSEIVEKLGHEFKYVS